MMTGKIWGRKASYSQVFFSIFVIFFTDVAILPKNRLFGGGLKNNGGFREKIRIFPHP
jgi:hypothetical protein